MHLLEVGVFSILNQLQHNSLCGGEVRSALLQPGQSKQTVCLAVERSNTHTYTHRDEFLLNAGDNNAIQLQKNIEYTGTFWMRQRQPQYEPPFPFQAGRMLCTVKKTSRGPRSLTDTVETLWHTRRLVITC